MIISLQILALIIFLSLVISGVISIIEKEKLAIKINFILAFIIPIPLLLIAFIPFAFQNEISIIILSIIIIITVLAILPMGRNKKYRQELPINRIDERDTMFSRLELKPDTNKYNEYYKSESQKRTIDDLWRKNPGLLNSKSNYYNPILFASSQASFETIDALKDKVDGAIKPTKTNTDTSQITSYIKSWMKKSGAKECGITELQDYHIYSVGGRGERYGKEYKKQHKFAIAITVEMSKEMVAAAPNASIVMESGQQYLESGKIAIQLANFIRNIGYAARAHIDGNYEVVCPLVARDAGLGEIGRMGLLMTKNLGPRVRIAVVTTDLPLNLDKPIHDFSMIDFCIKCKKCAENCPSQAISFTDREDIDGVLRWQINQEACFSLWTTLGTDCGRCISVCPFSHPDNFLHNAIRAGIRNSSIFRVGALKLDDVFYGKKPEIAEMPEWIRNMKQV